MDYNIPTYTLKTEENKIILYEDNFKKDSVTPNFAEFAATAKADDENNIISETYAKLNNYEQTINLNGLTFSNMSEEECGSI